jgi:hypothetical protein
MCRNRNAAFEACLFYIRWVPEVRYSNVLLSFFHSTAIIHTTLFSQFKRFVFVNYSQHPSLEQHHGRAINLNVGDPRLPFHGSFLIQEMRVRARWPFRADRPISLPIDWQGWISAC